MRNDLGKRVKWFSFAVNVSSSPSEQEHLDFVGEQHIHPSGYLEIIQGYFNCYIGFKMAKKSASLHEWKNQFRHHRMAL